MEAKINSEPDSDSNSLLGRVDLRPYEEIAPIYNKLKQKPISKEKLFLQYPKTRAREFLEECAKSLAKINYEKTDPNLPKTVSIKKRMIHKPATALTSNIFTPQNELAKKPKTAGKESAEFINTICQKSVFSWISSYKIIVGFKFFSYKSRWFCICTKVFSKLKSVE